MKKEIIESFKKRHNKKFDLDKYLSDFESGLKIKDLADYHEVPYDALRYLNYGLNLKSKTISERTECVLHLLKDLAKEDGVEYDIVYELEKEISIISEKNRKLVRSLTHTRDENNSLRKMQRLEDREDSIGTKILEEFSYRINAIKLPKIKQIKKTHKKKLSKEGLACIFSDIHFDDFIDPEVIPSGSYNYKIASDRLDYFTDRIISNYNQSETLIIYNLADNLKGIIHNGNTQGEEGIIASIIKAVEIFHGIYVRLSQHYKTIKIYHSGDNHSRLSTNPSTHNKWKDYNYLLYSMNDMLLKQSGVTNIESFFSKSGYHFNSINNHPIVSFHGDTLRSYKVHSESECSKLQDICVQMFGKRYKTALSGHQHHFAVRGNCYGGFNVQNGTSVGDSEYGVAVGFRGIFATQTIFFVHESGYLEDIHPIYLSHIK